MAHATPAVSWLAAALLFVATPAGAQSPQPSPPTKDELANDNNLFLSVARKALQWEEPTEPGQDRWTDLFRRHERTRCLPFHDLRRSHPDEHGHAVVRDL